MIDKEELTVQICKSWLFECSSTDLQNLDQIFSLGSADLR